jgi:hypothetical protein
MMDELELANMERFSLEEMTETEVQELEAAL